VLGGWEGSSFCYKFGLSPIEMKDKTIEEIHKTSMK
jgi:hypothetical protein